MKRALLLLIAIAALGIDCARALELAAWEGTSLTRPAPDGVWRQEGFPYQQNLDAKSRHIALSGWYNSWLKLEMNYIDFGDISGNLTYVSDENYSSNPKDPCRKPCEAPRSAVWSGYSQGLGLSAIPTVQFKDVPILNQFVKNGSAGIRLGVMKFTAETLVTAQNFHDNFVNDPNPSIGVYDMKNNGFSWYYGFNAKIGQVSKYGQVNLIYMQAPDIKAGFDGVQRGVKDLHLSYRLEF